MKYLILICFFINMFVPLFSAAESKNNSSNQAQLQRGKSLYFRFCSLCHGKNLEGQKNWRQRKPNGRLPAPPHDETGHTWHHPDKLLFSMTKYGLVPPNAPKNYPSDMPAWEGTLSDDDIWAILTFIKNQWPKDIQQYQENINRAAKQ